MAAIPDSNLFFVGDISQIRKSGDKDTSSGSLNMAITFPVNPRCGGAKPRRLYMVCFIANEASINCPRNGETNEPFSRHIRATVTQGKLGVSLREKPLQHVCW
ncbi:hypothetical protein HHI36_015832 [Cryptolaemus montrouzieri]|uniref:Uncharacterized protein n=1 Tax=Cryptolaemus montrouzieri TaxID=559131 RepID=A0ABD2N840_9CUCU